jgi:mono/diheme cytochrome c family protein
MGDVSRKGGVARRGIGAMVPFLCVVLAGCPPRADDGFDKVAARRDIQIAQVAKPDPPPVRGDLAGPAAALPPGVTQAMVEQGQQLYGTVCVACHGANGVGGAIGPALNDQNWIHITGEFEEIVQITTVGVAQPRQYPAAMPARGGGPFSDDEIRAIAAYVYAISRPETP